MIAPFAIFSAHFLNWLGLHLLRSSDRNAPAYWALLLTGYFGVGLVSCLSLGEGRFQQIRGVRGRDWFFSLLWAASVLLVYAVFAWKPGISQSLIFMGQSAAPIAVGMIFFRSRDRSRLAWMLAAGMVLLWMGFLRGGGGWSGMFDFFWVLVGFLGAQCALRLLLKSVSANLASTLIAFSMILLLVPLVVFLSTRSDWSIPDPRDGLLFTAILALVQVLVLHAFKKGDLLLTSLAQGSGVLIGVVLDSFAYGFRPQASLWLLCFLYLGIFSRISLLSGPRRSGVARAGLSDC
jgi:hypothetical protein